MSKPMTNYNERLDEILADWEYEVTGTPKHWDKTTDRLAIDTKAKQAITSLIKELVAEAKPKYQAFTRDMVSRGEVKQTIDQFEQNLLKALEEA